MKNEVASYKGPVLIFLTIVFIITLFFLPKISQDLHYHNFADQKTFLGIPNFMNVVSNLPFLIIGFIGIARVDKMQRNKFPKMALVFFFIGVLLTGFGSAYYHINPNNNTLLWDRLPMTIAFMSLFSAVVSLHIEIISGKRILFPILLIGIGSVIYWYITELNGQGDLRPYAFVQFYPMLFIPLIMFLYPVKGAVLKILLPMIGFYALAKYFEYADDSIYSFGQCLSGHTIKHVFAALATLPVLGIGKVYGSLEEKV
jgi:hypothetical protein